MNISCIYVGFSLSCTGEIVEFTHTNMSPNLIDDNLDSPRSPQGLSNGHTKGLESASFPGLIYSGRRGNIAPNIFDWLKVKRRDDNVGDFWRVHDKLYNLEDFVEKHPGGQDWIKFTKGTDITEAFEASHIVGFQNVERILSKYYVRDITEPRNSPYTFKPSGFYKTLKKRVEPVLKEVGTDPSPEALRIQDGLGLGYILLALTSVWMDSIPLQLIAGIVCGMCSVGAHNFFHRRDNWRMYYLDLGPLSSLEWRLSHAVSHHLYPNTILDFEIMLGEPWVEFFPKPKNFVHKYIAMFYMDFLYLGAGLSQVVGRITSIYQGKQDPRPENFLIFLELIVFLLLAPTYRSGFLAWIIIFMMASFWLIFTSTNAAHHHPTSFHDGDEARHDPDFGLCQLDATRGKSDWYHKSLFSVLTTFGEHPLHHLFPTVCHSKLKYLKPVLEDTLRGFSEEFPQLTQIELFIGTHKQMSRTTPNSHPKAKLK